MAEINPYASPLTDAHEPLPVVRRGRPGEEPPPSPYNAWRLGPLLVATTGLNLPRHCVVCNAPAPGPRVMLKLRWMPRVFYWLMLMGPIGATPLMFGMMFTLKEAKLRVSVCAEHARWQRQRAIFSWLNAAAASIAVMGFAFVIGEEVSGRVNQFGFFIFVAGLGNCVIWLYYLARRPRLLKAHRIKRQFAFVRGVCPEIVQSLPEFPPWLA